MYNTLWTNYINSSVTLTAGKMKHLQNTTNRYITLELKLFKTFATYHCSLACAIAIKLNQFRSCAVQRSTVHTNPIMQMSRKPRMTTCLALKLSVLKYFTFVYVSLRSRHNRHNTGAYGGWGPSHTIYKVSMHWIMKLQMCFYRKEYSSFCVSLQYNNSWTIHWWSLDYKTSL